MCASRARIPRCWRTRRSGICIWGARCQSRNYESILPSFLVHISKETSIMTRDERVQSAIDNWAPRFIANGIDYNDFQRVTNSVETWDDWCRNWSECGAMHEQMGEQA